MLAVFLLAFDSYGKHAVIFKTTIVRCISLKGLVAPRAFCRFLAPYIVARYRLSAPPHDLPVPI